MIRNLTFAGAVLLGSVALMVPAGMAGAADLDHKNLAKQVAVVVAPAYPDLPLGKVSCPKKIKRAVGTITTCLADAGGLSLEMKVTQTDKKGNVTIESTQAVIPKGAIEAFIAANATLPVTANCGPEPYLVRPPGTPVACTARFTDGTTQQVSVTVTDVAGNVMILQVT